MSETWAAAYLDRKLPPVPGCEQCEAEGARCLECVILHGDGSVQPLGILNAGKASQSKSAWGKAADIRWRFSPGRPRRKR